jgi:oligopeptide transport system substrate-binding protein
MQNDPSYTNIPKTATYYLEMNGNNNPIFKNLKVRQAMSLAVNRKEFIKKVLGNGSVPISTVVPSKMFYNKDGKDFTTEADKAVKKDTTYNLKQAKKLFAEGMKEMGKTSANFSLLSDDTEAAKSTLEYLQNALEKVSGPDAKLTVTTKSVPFKTRLQLSADRKFDMVVTAWSADFPDAISFLDLFTTGAAYNDGEWSNKTYDNAVKASKGSDAISTTKRWNDLQTAAQTLTKDMGVVPLYQLGEAHLIRTSVKGMQSCPNGMVNFVGATNNK